MRPYFALAVMWLTVVVGCDAPKPSTPNHSENPAVVTQHSPDDISHLLKPCAVCHGEVGLSSIDNAPLLAGQSIEYLYTSLVSQSSQQRPHPNRKTLFENLSQQQLRQIAEFYAAQPPRWNTASIAKDKKRQARQKLREEIKRGKLVPCESCHGKDGNSSNPGVPSLAILEPEYIELALQGYLSGQRIDPYMVNFKLALSQFDIRQLAAYFADQKPRKNQLPIKSDPKAGAALSQQCIGCHGLSGNSIVPPIPSLAGQNYTYLVSAMQSYRNGQRKNVLMRNALQGLRNEQLQQLAAYYADQTPTKGLTRPATYDTFEPYEDGEKIAMVCNGCHGPNGNSDLPDTPSLTRQHPTYIENAIDMYKNGSRKHQLMTTLVSYLDDVDIAKAAHFYAAQEPNNSNYKSTGDANRGRSIVAQCNNCHGTNGNSEKKSIPTLAGLSANYIVNAVAAYAVGMREHEDMNKAVSGLDKQAIKDIAAYYASRKPKKPAQHQFQHPRKLIQQCDRCHGKNGFSSDPTIPRIAGQLKSHLVNALLAYKTKQRDHSTMFAMAEPLSLIEIDAVAQFYADQKFNHSNHPEK